MNQLPPQMQQYWFEGCSDLRMAIFACIGYKNGGIHDVTYADHSLSSANTLLVSTRRRVKDVFMLNLFTATKTPISFFMINVKALAHG